MRRYVQEGAPETSTTLLNALARDSQSSRWDEFVARYRPMMEAFMRERFPSVDADDAIQETLVALHGIIPGYRYAPDEKGRFRCYLTGILRNKAMRVLRDERRQAEAVAGMALTSDQLLVGLTRLMFPFFAGLLLSRLHISVSVHTCRVSVHRRAGGGMPPGPGPWGKALQGAGRTLLSALRDAPASRLRPDGVGGEPPQGNGWTARSARRFGLRLRDRNCMGLAQAL